jgi:hypothetical protein
VTSLWPTKSNFILLLLEMEAGTQCWPEVNCLHDGTLLYFRLSPAVRPNLV